MEYLHTDAAEEFSLKASYLLVAVDSMVDGRALTWVYDGRSALLSVVKADR